MESATEQSRCTAISERIDKKLRRTFFNLARFVCTYPVKVASVCVLLSCLSLLGLLRFRREKRPQKAYIPQSSTLNANLDFIRDTFGPFPRFTSFLCTGKNTSVNLASRNHFLRCLQVLESGYQVQVDRKPQQLNFSSTCLKIRDVAGNVLCATLSPYDLFYDTSYVVFNDDLSVNYFRTVRNKLSSLSEEEFLGTLRDGPFVSVSNSKFEITNVLGLSNKNGSLFVSALIHQQFAESTLQVKNGAEFDPRNDALEEAWSDTILSTEADADLQWSVRSTFSEFDVFNKSLIDDVYLFYIGVSLLSIFVLLFLGDFHVVRSRILLGCAGLSLAGLSYLIALGISSAVGMFYGPIHEILPLIMFAIGVDDVFVLTKTLDSVNRDEAYKRLDPKTRVTVALSHGGTAITVTSVTNIVVFCLGAVSGLPALRYFALSTAIGIFAAWILSLTFYTAALYLDTVRQSSNRIDLCPWIKVDSSRDPMTEKNWFKKEPETLRRFFKNQYGPFLLHKNIRYLVIFIFLAMFSVGIWGSSRLYLNWSLSLFYLEGSNDKNYQNSYESNFKLGDSTYIHLSDTNIAVKKNQQRYFNLCNKESGILAQNKWIDQTSIDCWFTELLKLSSDNTNVEYIEPEIFISELQRFLNSPTGFKYNSDIAFRNGTIYSVRFVSRKILLFTSQENIEATRSIEKDLASVGFGNNENGNPKLFAYSYSDLSYEAASLISREITISLSLAITAVGLVCLQLIGNPFMVLLCLILVIMVVVDILGILHITGINLNAFSMLAVVVATGLSVDYIVHIARSFLEEFGSKSERAILSLESMGPAIFYSGFSTFSAIAILVFARAYPFKVIFVGFVSLILLGLSHGLVLGPVIYALTGPKSMYKTQNEKHEIDIELVQNSQ